LNVSIATKSQSGRWRGAVEMFERLVKQSPSAVENRSKLIEIAIMTDPWSVEVTLLPQLESRLRRARELVDQLAGEMPENLDHVQTQIHVYAKLGVRPAQKGSGGFDERTNLPRPKRDSP
jgi:hypothetical protein